MWGEKEDEEVTGERGRGRRKEKERYDGRGRRIKRERKRPERREVRGRIKIDGCIARKEKPPLGSSGEIEGTLREPARGLAAESLDDG